MDIVGAQMDCARADRVIPPALRANAGAGTGLDGAPSGSLVREDRSTAPLQADDWRDVAINSEVGEVRPEQFLLSQKAFFDRLCAPPTRPVPSECIDIVAHLEPGCVSAYPSTRRGSEGMVTSGRLATHNHARAPARRDTR